MILVTGAKGQLGTDLAKELTLRGLKYKGVDSIDFDITNIDDVEKSLKELMPSSVIHCAAYTAVDAAEDDNILCMKVNRDGTDNIAKICKEINSEMIYISTDYVFDGDGSLPYETDAPKQPLQVYGKSKLAGEVALQSHLERCYIVRTSWVFGENGNNFVKTMLRLSQDRDDINVVNDQIGSPTFTVDLAVLLCDMVLSGKYGVYHATNEGFCSWAEFAQEIIIVSGSSCRIHPIPTEQYPTKAQRPKNSRLSKASLDYAGFARLPEWRDALARYL